MMSRPAVLASLFAFLAGAAAADPAIEKPGKPDVTASLIPVGANSDAYWVGDGPGIRAIALDPGAAPPATLAIRDRKGFLTIPTILNRPSPALPVRAGSLRVFASQQPGDAGDPPLFANFKLPETPGHYDIFLNRAENQKGWDEADSLILPASTSAFSPGSFRLVNLSAMPVRWKIGNQIVDLAPRRARMVRPGRTGRLIPFQAAHRADDGFQIILQTGIRLASDQRANVIAYPGRNPKKPCEITWYYQFEPTPASVPADE